DVRGSAAHTGTGHGLRLLAGGAVRAGCREARPGRPCAGGRVDRAGGARSPRPTRLARGQPAARRRPRGGRRRRARRGAATRVIYGLAAALGWGFSDFAAAVSGRRVGAFATVVVSHVASALLTTVL